MTEELKIISADVSTWGTFQGKKELVAYLGGLTVGKAPSIKAKCYDCMGGYPDGAMDCLLVRCALYPYMPYKGKELTQTQAKKIAVKAKKKKKNTEDLKKIVKAIHISPRMQGAHNK